MDHLDHLYMCSEMSNIHAPSVCFMYNVWNVSEYHLENAGQYADSILYVIIILLIYANTHNIEV